MFHVSKFQALRNAAEVALVVGQSDLPRGRLPYLLDASELPTEFSEVAASFQAYTAKDLDAQFRPYLESQSLWHGRHFAAVFFLDRIADHFGEAPQIALHELAHHIEYLALAKARVKPGHPFMRTMLGVCMTDLFDGCRCQAHGPAFVRACCHLLHRAERYGVGLSGLAGEFYGLSDCTAWRGVFRDECNKYGERSSIAEMLLQPLPDEAIELFDDDLEYARAQR